MRRPDHSPRASRTAASTAGPSEEPPIPSTTTVSSSTASANERRRLDSRSISRGTSSHPRRFAETFPAGQRLPSRSLRRAASCFGSEASGTGFLPEPGRLLAQAVDHLVEGLLEGGDSLLLERGGHLVDRDPERLEVGEDPLGIGLRGVDRAPHRAVVEELLDRLLR